MAGTYIDSFENAYAEALHFLPRPAEYKLGPDAYLEQVRRLKAALDVPVIGSLNGCTDAGWLDFARRIQEAGADALELNVYAIPTNPQQSGEALERRVLDMARHVKASVDIPVAIKLSPFFTAPVHLAVQLADAGLDGLVVAVDPERAGERLAGGDGWRAHGE